VSVGRIRAELAVALERVRGGSDRRADIAVFISAACTNVVVHAYVGTRPGPLYAAVTLADRDLIVSVCDCGRAMVARPDSAGAGLGVPLMTRDRLWKASAAAGEGHLPTRNVRAGDRGPGAGRERTDTP
jgi:anti-sigma regulatory factor (Ser/Thr protein kinase)